MTKTAAKAAPKANAPAPVGADAEDDDIFEGAEFVSLPDPLEETINRDSRRKIEIYWEKRHLREQFEDFNESEFGF